MSHHEFPYPSAIASVNGCRMHYIDWGREERPPVVLLHGNYSWAYTYRHFVPHFIEAGFRCVIPDHVGFGRSNKPQNGKTYTFDFHSANLEAFIGELGLKNVTLVGQEWGGLIALDYATKRQENLKALVLMNSGPFLTTRNSLWSRWVAGSYLWNTFGRRLNVGMWSGYPLKKVYYKKKLDQAVRLYYRIRFSGRASRAGTLGFLRMVPTDKRHSSWAPVKAIQGKLPEMYVPTLLIGSRNDPVFGVSEARALKALLPRTELRTLDDGGSLLQEDRPDLLSRWIVDFLRRV